MDHSPYVSECAQSILQDDGQMYTVPMPLELIAGSASSRELVEGYVARRTRKLKAALRDLESFNRNVAHDLRNPLGNIASLASLARNKIATGDARGADHLLSLVHGEAVAAGDLLHALLALAAAESSPMNRQPVALQQLAEQAAVAVTRLDTGFDSDRISISGDFPVVEGDACLLKQVFVNLVGNAVKFSLPASTIEIRAFRRPGSVCVQVADRGIGFDHSVAERLFEPFYRVHSRERGGHGLGLSIVRRIIERHGGCVYARPRPGGGALFEFSLQLDATDTPALMATTLSEALSKPSTATHG